MLRKWSFWIPIVCICLLSIPIASELSGVSIGSILGWVAIWALVAGMLFVFCFWLYCVYHVLLFCVKPETLKNQITKMPEKSADPNRNAVRNGNQRE